MNPITLATIGTGAIVHSILDNVRLTEAIRLTAVYSRSEAAGRALAAEYGAPKVCTDIDALLADEAAGFIYIASPNHLHYEQAKKALLADKNVICEKPLCPKASQARELADLAKARSLYLIDDTPTAFLPNLEILRQQLPKIGRIRLVLAKYSQYSKRYDQLINGGLPNVFNPACAGGCLMDINYYNVYLTAALFGKPLRASYHPNLHSSGIDTSGIVTADYGAFTCSLAAAKDTWGVNSYQIEGEQGYIYIPNGSNGLTQIEVTTKTGTEVFSAQPNPDRWSYEVEALARLLQNEDAAAISQRLEVTLTVIEILETLRRDAGICFPEDERGASGGQGRCPWTPPAL